MVSKFSILFALFCLIAITIAESYEYDDSTEDYESVKQLIIFVKKEC